MSSLILFIQKDLSKISLFFLDKFDISSKEEEELFQSHEYTCLDTYGFISFSKQNVLIAFKSSSLISFFNYLFFVKCKDIKSIYL